MNEELIPWDFFGLLALVIVALVVVICCVAGLKARRRARLTNPRRDYVYGSNRQARSGRPQD